MNREALSAMRGTLPRILARALLLGGVVLFASARPLKADIPIWDPASVPNHTVVDFETSVIPGLMPGDPLPANAFTGITLGSLEGLRWSSSSPGGTGNILLDVLPAPSPPAPPGSGLIEIIFDTPVTAVGIQYFAPASIELFFEAYDSNDMLIGTPVSTMDPSNPASGMAGGFFGVDGQGTHITSIRVHDTLFGFSVDNLTFQSVPAPGGMVLATLGLGFLGLVTRRLI